MRERSAASTASRRSRRRALVALLLATLVLLATAAVALAAGGDLTQKPGTAGCISEDGTSGPPSFTPGSCADAVALEGAGSVTVSPDGSSAYVASQDSDAVAVFDRNPNTGALTQKPGSAGCISDDGSGACSDGAALDGAASVTVSPDGDSAYVASQDSDAVAVFDRNPNTGALTQKPGSAGCISDDGSGACTDGVALDGARSVTVSADGESAYAASLNSDAVAVFDRESTTGKLTQKPGRAGCVSEDGSSGFPSFTPGACTDGVALDGAASITVSADGLSAYAASLFSDAVAVFDRDPGTGRLTRKPGTAGCISDDGSGACSDGAALDAPLSVSVSPDGESAYAASQSSDAVVVFDRDPTTGELTQKPGSAGCISETGTGGACAEGVALDGAASVTVSPDGASAYVASLRSGAVVVLDRDVPPPEPPSADPLSGLTLLKSLHELADWSDGFVAGSVGTIKQTAAGIEFVLPPAGRDQQLRNEVQFHGDQPIPGEYGYRWEVKFPSGYSYGNLSDRQVNIAQFHTNLPCYTGGLRLDGGEPSFLGTRLKGGPTSSWSGSCTQEYDERIRFPYEIPRDRFVKIEVRALWHESDGWMKVWADGELVFEIAGVPTAGRHDQVPPGDEDGATRMKFRLGFYGKEMPSGGKMIVRGAEVYRG